MPILRCIDFPPVVLGRPKRRDEPAGDVVAAFGRVVEAIERAKEILLSAVPRGRGSSVPLAEALWGFESGIAEAREAMSGWRTPETENDWVACHSALGRSASAAEALRLGEPPDGYEELYGRLDELLEPLDSFSVAAERFRRGKR